MTLLVPMMLVLMASIGLYSQAGTCLSAAAWTTIPGLLPPASRRGPPELPGFMGVLIWIMFASS
jgi:hypothetical protein